MASSRVSKYFNETPEERRARIRELDPPPPKQHRLKTPAQPEYKGLPFLDHRTLAEAWKWKRYDTWKKR